MRKFLAIPFSLIGVILFSIGLLIRFGISDAGDIVEEFQDTIKKYK